MDAACSDSVVIWRRPVGLAIGATAQLMFAVTVAWLYLFLTDTAANLAAPAALATMLLGDLGLALLFAVPHSLLRFPQVQSAICRVMSWRW